MMRLCLILTLGALCLLGCEDQTPKGAADAQPNNNGAADLGGEDLVTPDLPAPDMDTPDAAPDLDTPDDGPPPECTPGARECSQDNLSLRTCRGNGQWDERPCADGYSCQGNECFPDANICREGQRICLNAEQPAVCDPGVAWNPLDPCPDGLACLNGECRSRRCADAAQVSSYLGCDYIAVDLPNLAYSEFGGTAEAPIGVVLANASDEEPVLFSVFRPDGALAPIVDEREIPPSAVANPFDMYQPVTVRSEIRTASGRVANAAFSQAERLEIPPGGIAVILLDHHGYFETTRVGDQTWYIQTTNPVAAYQFSPYCCNYSFTNDASLLFPTTTFGTEYFHLGVPAWAEIWRDTMDGTGTPPDRLGIPSNLTVVSAADNTRVRVELPAGAELRTDGASRVMVQSGEASVTLNRFEVMHLVTQTAPYRGDRPPIGPDLSGARITADKPIGVFSGHLCTFYPQLFGACDHLEEQLFPTDTWGQDFVLIPPKQRSQREDTAEAIYWKLIARDDNTRAELTVPYAELNPLPPGFEGVPDCADFLDGDRTIVLGRGQHCEFGTKRAAQLIADGPMMIMGVITGQNSTGTFNAFNAHAGDPAIFLVPPRSQFRDEYAFLTPTTYFGDYLTIITSPQASVELDGQIIDLNDATDVPGSNLVYKHILLEVDGPHRLNSTFPTGILVYAYDDYVSYAFTGGLNLIKR